MPIYRGTYYPRVFLFTDKNGVAVDITGWEFLAHFKGAKTDPDPPLLELSTANGGWEVTNGPAGQLQMNILSDKTPLLTSSKVYFDVLRTDAVPGPMWLFEASVPVKDPITHV